MKKPSEANYSDSHSSEIMEETCKLGTPTIREDVFGLMLQGKCPHCGRKIRHWESPSGRYAPEVWSALRSHGIDPATGHSLLCKAKDLRL
jgi:hypothetical protein